MIIGGQTTVMLMRAAKSQSYNLKLIFQLFAWTIPARSKELVKLTSFTKCSYCGKLTFIDLLDEAMMCEYCREHERTRLSCRKIHDPRKKLRLHKTAVGSDGCNCYKAQHLVVS